MRVQLVANIHGKTDRHLRARSNWTKDAITREQWARNTVTELGNDRPLPYLKDLLQAGLETDADVVLITNDDCSFSENALEKIARHCQVFEYGCVRRDKEHIGREAFFFLSTWLREHISEMPDVIICIDRWDLIIARWLRNFRDFKTTGANLIEDFFPVDCEPGLIEHESHSSWWTGASNSPASKWNAKLWLQE